MTLYYRITDPADVRDISDQVAAWLAAGNPKANDWTEQPPAPSPDAVWTNGAWMAPEPSTPLPDWETFKSQAINSSTLNQILIQAYQSVPVAAGALVPSLLNAEKDNSKDFSASWTIICSAVSVSSEVIDNFIQVATNYNLPKHFIDALNLNS
jgi:hypothetical protein